ncbi:plexin-A4-like [Antedon mediterranea]|uniref:plexin-A4-like n=1 Tax=Antedon mediterranea TaxID=105859 RepID=UPI003AF997C8
MASSGMAVRCILVQLSILYSLSFLADNVRSESLDVYSNFAADSSSDETFFHLAVRSNGEVYISSQRYIYRLSDSLDVIERSNKTCSEDKCAIINKILVVDEENERLITCGSDENEDVQSQCESRLIDDLTPEESAKDIVSRGHDSSIGYLATKDDMTYLYIAASVSSFYTISIRSTISFKVYDSNENTFRVKDVYKRDDLVNYVGGFSYKRFRYFVANIYDFDNNIKGKVPRISRICDGDSLDHLSDIYLQCVNGTTKYQNIQAVYFGPAGSDLSTAFGVNKEDMLLYGVFTRSATDAESALCIYTLKDIEKAFDGAIFGCLFSKANAEEYVLTYGAPRTQCSATDNPASNVNIENYKCRNTDAISTSQGSVNHPTTADAVLALKNDKLKAITINIERGHTIAFLGTENGRLLKTHLTSNTSARIYEDIELAKRSPVRSDMMVNNETLLVLTEKELFRVRLENCAQYTTCDECIGTNLEEDGDPYCGWCTLDKKCSTYDTCSSGAWLAYDNICIAIDGVSPPNVPYNDGASTLKFEFTNLPPVNENSTYLCIFDGTGAEREATLKKQTLSCESPDVLPPVPDNSDHVSVTIYILSTLTQVKFIETSYDFFSCNSHTGCSSCVESGWGCDWCVLSNLCTIDQTECKDQSIVLQGENVTSAARCPQIVNGQSQQLHVGVSDEFVIKTVNVPEIVSNFYCQVETLQSKLNAKRKGDDIICDRKAYEYAEDVQNITTKVTVLWVIENVDTIIDNEYNVTLYNCSVERPDCSRCLSNITAEPSLDCVWCGNGKGCTVSNLCSNEVDVCPAPKITKVTPTTLATMGKTASPPDLVTIKGVNLGQKVEDVVSVTIDGESSSIVQNEYIVGESVTVQAPKFTTEGDKDVVLVIKGSDGEDLSSKSFKLKYQNPEVTSFSPLAGPMSGGITITVHGKLFKTGSEQKVMIDYSPCLITNISDTIIKCQTTKVNISKSYVNLYVYFSNEKRVASKYFKFDSDPLVDGVRPRSTILSGGRVLTITGYGFNLIQKPSMRIYWGSYSFEKECLKPYNDSAMFCPTPDLSSVNHRFKRQSDDADKAIFTADVGFRFANVKKLLTWSEHSMENVTMQIYPDPIYYLFNDTEKYKSNVVDGVFDLKDDGTLQLMGERLALASTKEDVVVYIGNKICSVSLFSAVHLQCIAPEKRPKENLSGTTLKGNPLVTVVHGNIEVVLGPVKYPMLSWWLYAVLAAIGTLMLLILVFMILFFYCKTKKIEQDKERVMEEMELLEKSVREDSRRAIAELATNLDDLTNELEGTGMPFLTMLDYMKKMMFTGYDHVPADHGSDTTESYLNEHGLKEFAKLLGKKDFLIAFIEMVEENKNISKKEKGNFASLLTVGMISERKLPYFTEVLTDLLKDYISDGVVYKRSKQLFRWTESVREKLVSNWVALCMYDHLKDHAGYPLFLLYQAIKYKVWKGPVDAVTQKSYHSLSIDHLFKDSVDFEEIKLTVAMDNKGDADMISVNVLTCDCISQVKEKILDAMYKSRPYSNRPSASSVDLDLRAGKHGHLVLSDIDNTSKTVNNWRQLNTLEHFKIRNGSLVALVPKQEVANAKPSSIFISPTTVDHLENTINMDAKYGFNAEDSNLEKGAQPWHLVKDVDPLEDEQRNSRRKNKTGSIYRRKLKTIHEVHFPRLMSTKTTIQKYVDGMFRAMLKAPSDDSDISVPVTIKYLFDFFDAQAEENDAGQAMAKTWKNNSLGQRFWVTVITHPNFIFDILQTLPVEAALKIIAETLLDSCSVEAIKYTKDTSTNRLLYTREVPKYREYVNNFYSSIQKMPTAAKNF